MAVTLIPFNTLIPVHVLLQFQTWVSSVQNFNIQVPSGLEKFLRQGCLALGLWWEVLCVPWLCFFHVSFNLEDFSRFAMSYPALKLSWEYLGTYWKSVLRSATLIH